MPRTSVVVTGVIAAAAVCAAGAVLLLRHRGGAGGSAAGAEAQQRKERKIAQESAPRDGVVENSQERQYAFELLQVLKQRANLAFQQGRYEDAIAGYQDCIQVTSSLGAADAEAVEAEQVIRANVVMTLVKQQRAEDARLVATMLLQDELCPLPTDLKVKVLYRRGLASKALGDREAALADFRAAVFFSPQKDNPAAKKEIEALQKP